MGETLELRNIGKKYGEHTILKEIDLAVAAGERIVLLGPSGSGKIYFAENDCWFGKKLRVESFF
ncbi:hypothetical protein [Enterococcus faecium]